MVLLVPMLYARINDGLTMQQYRLGCGTLNAVAHIQILIDARLARC
jgi:hypothetical protein